MHEIIVVCRGRLWEVRIMVREGIRPYPDKKRPHEEARHVLGETAIGTACFLLQGRFGGCN